MEEKNHKNKENNENEKNKKVDHLEDDHFYIENGKLMIHEHEVGGLAVIMGDFTRNHGRVIGLFALLVIISGNFLGDLFPKTVRDTLKNNIYMKHVFAFMTLFFFVFLTMPNIRSEGVGIVFGIYLLFVVSSKLDATSWFTLVFLISVLYLLEIREDIIIRHYRQHKSDKSGDMDMKYITIIDNWIRPGTLLSVIGIGIYGIIGIVRNYFKMTLNKRVNFFKYLFTSE